MVISADSRKGNAVDSVEIECSGIEVKNSFTPSFIIDFLKSLDDDDFSYNFNKDEIFSPVLLSDEKGYDYIVMPLRVNTLD